MKRKGDILADPSLTKKDKIAIFLPEKERKYVEYKSVGYDNRTATCAAVGTWIYCDHLNLLTEGTNSNQRVGDRMIMTRLNMRLYAYLPSGVPPNAVRILVVYDSGTNGAISPPSITDVLESDNFLSFNNLSNSDRFLIVVDEIVSPISFDFIGHAEINRTLNLKTIFGPGATLLEKYKQGALFLYMCQANNLPDTVIVKYTYRVRFIDD